ncbi:response regulator [Autumnicola psychrophila]|uniref:Response regulator n=1 Tax=Autumnicola psychrophila TaxID=3075592 RepID=A0ABU3DR27_9FLAO|nr:response regulator [Zunongwangia sp. F225]MDT0686166.1 response regulator [Zunongwangia sp. F225]
MSPIYLIDDQPIANFITKKLLEVEGYKENIQDFTNPIEAFAIVEQEKKNALIFLDLNMPEMTGWEFLEEMRRKGVAHKTIILTSSTSELDQQKAIDYPWVVEYVVKPLNKEKFKLLSSYLKPPSKNGNFRSIPD